MRPGLKIGLKIDRLFVLKIAMIRLKIGRGGGDRLKITDIDLKIEYTYTLYTYMISTIRTKTRIHDYALYIQEPI